MQVSWSNFCLNYLVIQSNWRKGNHVSFVALPKEKNLMLFFPSIFFFSLNEVLWYPSPNLSVFVRCWAGTAAADAFFYKVPQTFCMQRAGGCAAFDGTPYRSCLQEPQNPSWFKTCLVLVVKWVGSETRQQNSLLALVWACNIESLQALTQWHIH